jgi:hypothetical protein
MDGHAGADSAILGGSVGDGDQTLRAARVADEDQIRDAQPSDPWVSAGLLRIGTIEPRQLWLDSRASSVTTRSDARKAWVAGAGACHPTRA